jgi:hypothetical protein
MSFSPLVNSAIFILDKRNTHMNTFSEDCFHTIPDIIDLIFVELCDASKISCSQCASAVTSFWWLVHNFEDVGCPLHSLGYGVRTFQGGHDTPVFISDISLSTLRRNRCGLFTDGFNVIFFRLLRCILIGILKINIIRIRFICKVEEGFECLLAKDKDWQ